MTVIKTLFITDLDGTLLNSNKRIPCEGISLLKSRIEKGLPFSIATARSAATVGDFCRALGVRLPVILMNGVFVYDVQKQTYLHKNFIPHAAMARVLYELSARGLAPFFYSLEDDNHLCVEYTDLQNNEMKDFYAARAQAAYKRFEKVKHFVYGSEKHMVYITMIDSESTLRPMYDWVKSDPELSASLYRDNYSENWYLEIYSIHADKMTGVAWLKKYTGAQRVVVFGDNYNDIAMLQYADEGYAVEEAPDEVKAYATGIIGSHNENAVARFIANDFDDLQWEERGSSEKTDAGSGL